MKEEQITRLGSPFYSLKQKGTGLGLMISYRIIAAFNGRITVSCTEEKGTTFVVALPDILGKMGKGDEKRKLALFYLKLIG